jgi:hypothetical protein
MMNYEAAAQIGTFASALAAVIMIVVAIRAYRRQTNALVFLEYTKRYEVVMTLFPTEARRARLNLDGEIPEPNENLTVAVLRYLNLCSEEFYLCQRGYLAKDVWKIWEAELKRTLQSPLVKREWGALNNEFQAYPEFQLYVEAAQNK